MLLKSPFKKSNPASKRFQKSPKVTPKPFDAYFANPANSNGYRKTESSNKGKAKVRPGRIILGSLAIGLFGFMYITHVFTTQKALQEVSNIRLEHERLKIIFEEQALSYEQLIGPAQIYERAKSLGFIDSTPNDRVLNVKRR